MRSEHHQAVTNIVHNHANGRLTEEDAVQQFRDLLHDYREKPLTQGETLYACVNDRPVPTLTDEPLVLVGKAKHPEQEAVFADHDNAIEERDRIPDQSGNPDINVYQLTVEPVAAGDTGE